MAFFFQNGKAAKVPLSSYETKQNRRKLVGAYSDKAELAAVRELPEEGELAIQTTNGRLLLVHSTQIPEKTTRNTLGVAVIIAQEKRPHRQRKGRRGAGTGQPAPLPGAQFARRGALLRPEDVAEQITL